MPQCLLRLAHLPFLGRRRRSRSRSRCRCRCRRRRRRRRRCRRRRLIRRQRTRAVPLHERIQQPPRTRPPPPVLLEVHQPHLDARRELTELAEPDPLHLLPTALGGDGHRLRVPVSLASIVEYEEESRQVGHEGGGVHALGLGQRHAGAPVHGRALEVDRFGERRRIVRVGGGSAATDDD